MASLFDNGHTLTMNEDERRRKDYLDQLVINELSSRINFFNNLLDQKRNLDDECNYPKGAQDAEYYQRLFNEEGIANRVVKVYAKECWQVTPWVYEDEDSENVTQFEKDWDELGKSLRGIGWFKQEKSSAVWEYLGKVDELSGIGQFGVLLMGFDDGLALDQPLQGVPLYGVIDDLGDEKENPTTKEGLTVVGGDKKQLTGMGNEAQYQPINLSPTTEKNAEVEVLDIDELETPKKKKLTFLRAFPETLVLVTQFETNQNSPRFGQPLMYQITLNDPQNSGAGNLGSTQNTVDVHWTRVIHIAEDPVANEVYGTPRMYPVLRRLLDLRKIYGSSAEMFYLGAFAGHSFETHPQLGGDVIVDRTQLRNDYENYRNSLQRGMINVGMEMKGLAPQVSDPTSQINVQIEAICIQMGIPVRVFKGSERGELASSQDDASWNDRLKHRQNSYVTPRIIVPFIDRLILAGVLSKPKDGYHVEWPDLDSNTDASKATIASTIVTAMSAYVAGNVESLMSPFDFFVHILGMEEETVRAILETAEKEADKKAKEDQATADEHGMIPEPPEGFQHPPEPPKPQPPIKVKPGEKLVQPKPPSVNSVTDNYNPDQARDSHGRFGSGDSTKVVGGVPLRDIVGTDVTSKEDKTTGERILDKIKGGYGKVKEGMSKVGQAVYDKLPSPLQEAIQVGKVVEHKLDKLYASGQHLAKEVARQRGHSEEHVEAVGKVMAVCDGIQRWTTNVPGLHTALHTFAEVGGPVGFLAAKAGFYVPVASLGYVATQMAKETIAGKNPFKMVNEARKRVRDAMGKQSTVHNVSFDQFIANYRADQLRDAKGRFAKEEGTTVGKKQAQVKPKPEPKKPDPPAKATEEDDNDTIDLSDDDNDQFLLPDDDDDSIDLGDWDNNDSVDLGDDLREKASKLKDTLTHDKSLNDTISQFHANLQKSADLQKQADEHSQESKKLQERYDTVIKGSNEKLKEYWKSKLPIIKDHFEKAAALNKEASDLKAEALTHALGIQNPTKIEVQHNQVNPHQKQQTDSAINWLNGKVSKDTTKTDKTPIAITSVPKEGEQRSFYRAGDGIFLSDTTNDHTVVHEFGHHLEENPHIRELAHAFIEHRFGNEPQVPMKDVCPSCGYGDHELGRKDDMEKTFGNHAAYYVGKTYGGGQTEVVSMGLEQMHRDPVGFSKKDPEYFKFMVHVLKGGKTSN